MLSEDAKILRGRWSEERAFRTGMTLAAGALVLGSIGTVLDTFYMDRYVIAGDFLMLAGCLLSIVLSRRHHPKRRFVWWPVYFCFILSTMPMVWVTGGVSSQWIGLCLALMVIVGTAMQVNINPLYNLGVAFVYLLFWLAVGHFVEIPLAVSSPPMFTVTMTSLCLSGIGYCIYSLLLTERVLAVEISKQYDDLYMAREKLAHEENANQFKTMFLANMSHELRTPLSSILGYCDLLQEGAVTEADQKQFLETIRRNGVQLAQMVDDLLDVSKVEAGRIELVTVELDTLPLICESMNQVASLAHKKNLDFDLELLSPVPQKISSDAVRIKQVLRNLMDNAIKFTEAGSIKVCLTFVLLSHGRGELAISIRDTGCGILPGEMGKLFRPFTQADSGLARRYGGTGMGLNLSREVARLLGGDLALTWSQPGQGSEFIFRLPVEVTHGGALISALNFDVAALLKHQSERPRFTTTS